MRRKKSWSMMLVSCSSIDLPQFSFVLSHNQSPNGYKLSGKEYNDKIILFCILFDSGVLHGDLPCRL